MAQTMSVDFAEATINQYVCARCWSRLHVTYHDHQYWVECTNLNCNGEGYVTKGYAEKSRAQSYYDLMDARQNLRDIIQGANPVSKLSEAQIMKELGF